MLSIITSEVIDKGWYLPLKLDVEGLHDIKAAVMRVPDDNPVDVGVVVHIDTNWRIRINVSDGVATGGGKVEGLSETVKIGVVVSVIFMSLPHG